MTCCHVQRYSIKLVEFSLKYRREIEEGTVRSAQISPLEFVQDRHCYVLEAIVSQLLLAS
jgi:hypothetical protein